MAPAMLLLILIRPFVLIRIGRLRTSIIGHLAINTEMYLCEVDTGLRPPRAFDIFFIDSCKVCNYQLKKMWGRHNKLRIFRFYRLGHYLYKTLCFYPGFQRHLIHMGARDRHGILEDCKPHLAFKLAEEEFGKESLLEMGIVRKPFICINARDKAYKETIFPERDWSYHDYNNMDVDTYIPAIEKLADHGYYIVRMGSVVSKRLSLTRPEVIDYATNGMRTDFLDIYLSANCYFFISNGSGLDSVPRIFRRPTLYVNSIPLKYINGACSYDLTIPKKIWIRNEHRFMTFREILESGVGGFGQTEEYEKNNLEIIHNTPAEIAAAATEMDERLKGTWATTEEDEDLQKRFWALFTPSKINRVFRSRIGTEFLFQNRQLLR